MGHEQINSDSSFRARVKEFYDNLAKSGNYQNMYDKERIWGKLKREQLAWLEKNMEYVANGTVLDVGCGPGFHLPLLLRKGARQAVGIDVSANMLKVIQLKEYKDRIDLLCADLLNLPIKSRAVDGLVCFDTLHHLQKICRERAISALIDVVSEGSRIYIDIKNSRNPILALMYRGKEDSYLPMSSMSPRDFKKNISALGVIEKEEGIGFPLDSMAPWIIYKIRKEKKS